ncbi:prepilin-type N-terminal cleavage/methylation domain-containing protein [Thalassospira sp.]|uniref:prepilin-type N-terminal cleavage/methylation domain-containing protein n=1 Tax=Thalassospira sp. TaxID=1912094 RepID=UPI0032EF545A
MGTRRAGFTLIELLIVLVIAGTIFTAVFGGLSFGSRIWDVSYKSIEARSKIIVVQQIVRRQLADIVLLTETHPTKNGEEERSSIVGNSTRLQMISGYPRALSNGSANEFAFYLDGAQMVMEWWAVDTLGRRSNAEQLHEKRVLLDGVSSLTFRYLPRGPAGPLWQSFWQRNTAIPDLVEMNVEFADTRLEWPKFLAEPRWANEPRFY